jgi:hypothetical protein
VCAAVVVVLVAVISLGVAAGGSGPKHTITGTLTITQGDSANSTIRLDPDGTCTGYGRDGGITPGAKVTVKDAKGDTVATARLGSGTSQQLANPSTLLHGPSGTCTFDFKVAGIPDSDHYDIDVAGTRLRRTQKQLRDDSWSIRVDANDR